MPKSSAHAAKTADALVTDPRVDEYIANAPAFAQPILKHLRSLIHAACPEAQETIKWSMPHFQYRDAMLCGFAAFKAHCTFGFWHRGMEEVLAPEGPKTETAMGSFGRIASREDLPSDAKLTRYIRAAMKLNEAGIPGRPRTASKTSRPEIAIPDDLASALKKNAVAAKTFSAFPPSHRREYIEWITEAKRAETREQRLATTLEWLAEGKSRNWKYKNC